ncbi:MAG: hypothetical protein HY684_03650 [Chloroflexi bacterium]|nr:hypothetical protein [Chloroflexota bacterium]
MERAREHGKRIGRPKVSERDGFAKRFAAVVARITGTRRALAPTGRQGELAIGYATLKRLLDAQASPLGGDSSRAMDNVDRNPLSMLSTAQRITTVEEPTDTIAEH